MKFDKSLYLFLVGVLYLTSCNVDSQDTNSFAADTPFTMDFPAWNDKRSGDPLNIVSRIRDDRQCYFDLNEAPVPANQYREVVRDYMTRQKAKILSTDPLSYEFQTPDKKYTFLAKTRGLDCDDKSYLATITCLKQNYDQDTATRIFGSMRCGDESAGGSGPDSGSGGGGTSVAGTVPESSAGNATGQKPKLGIVVSPQGEFKHKNISNAFRLAKQAGASMTRHYVSWADIEKSKNQRIWKGNDYMIDRAREAGLKLSVAFHTIRTAVRGPLPSDLEFRRWDDPELIARFSDFLLAFLKRYDDIVDYVEIGSEVNAYFSRHPQEVKPYRLFFEGVYKNVKAEHPRIMFGIVFAYRELQESGNFSVYDELSIGDHDAFTLYFFEDYFAHTREPRQVFDDLQDVARLTGNRRFAIEEVGWSAWPGLTGTESAQREAVSQFFDFLEQAPDRLEFISWFNLHDGREQDCNKIAESFTRKGDAMSRNKKAMQAFSDFLCHLGLRENSGKPRAGWNEWVARAKKFNNM